MLELHKIIRVSHVIVFAVLFIFFYEQSWEGGVFKVQIFKCSNFYKF